MRVDEASQSWFELAPEQATGLALGVPESPSATVRSGSDFYATDGAVDWDRREVAIPEEDKLLPSGILDDSEHKPQPDFASSVPSFGGFDATDTRKSSDFTKEQLVQPSIEGEARRTPTELLAILEPAAAGLAASADRARARGLGTEFDVTLAGQTHRFTLGAALVHVTTHGMHHRAQCLNMLRHLGVPGGRDRLPEIDPLDWQVQAKA